MTSASKLLRVFAVCAGVAAYVALEKYDSERKSAQEWPDRQAQETMTNDFENPLTAVFSRMFVHKFVNRYCSLSPDEDSPYDISKLVTRCTEEMHRTDSGDFLIRLFLQKEYEKENGLSPKPEHRPDPEPFRFVG
jgi:hypothetical protein